MISKNLSVFVFALFALVIVAGIGSAAVLTITEINYPSSVSATAGSFQIIFKLTNTGVDTDVTFSNQPNQGTVVNPVIFAPSNPVGLPAGESKVITATVNFNSQIGPINGTIIANPLENICSFPSIITLPSPSSTLKN